MNKLIYYIPILLIVACNQDNPRIGVIDNENLSQTQIDSILDEYNFVYADLTLIDSTNQVLFPISTQRYRGGTKFRGSGYEPDGYPKYWNMLFYNSLTGKTNLLRETKIRIDDFKCNILESGPVLKNSILYEIGDTDYNKDKKLNYEDPLYLFVSRIDGSELTRLSPINEDLEYYKIIPNSDKIIFKTKRDVDKDFDFDKEDQIIWYQIDLSDDETLVEILSNTDRKLIEKLYFEQWLVKE